MKALAFYTKAVYYIRIINNDYITEWSEFRPASFQT